MPDVFDKAKRSEIMSSIKSKNGLSTELRLAALFKENRIIGWRRNFKIFGKPDFVFPKKKIAIFVDGCFWHGCVYCKKTPNTNKTFWERKISRNKKRDKEVSNHLRHLGWKVIRIKECQLKKHPQKQLGRVILAML